MVGKVNDIAIIFMKHSTVYNIIEILNYNLKIHKQD